MFVYTCIEDTVYTWVWVWRSEVNIKCLLNLLLTLFFEVGSLVERETNLATLGSKQAPEVFLPLPPHHHGFVCGCWGCELQPFAYAASTLSADPSLQPLKQYF